MTPEFSTTLLREKFVLRDADEASAEAPVIALSNRMVVTVSDPGMGQTERFVVRAQNMHSCARMAARIAGAATEGSLTEREPPFDWSKAWDEVTEGYEARNNPQRWAVVYHQGKPVFAQGDHHPFLDVIEGFDAKSGKSYDDSVPIAQEAFRKAGKDVRIEHDSNIALVVHIEPKLAKIGVILRGAARTATFNVQAKPRGGASVRVSACLSVAAAFLEGIQLAFQVGMGRVRRHYGMLEAGGPESKKLSEGETRLGRLNAAIRQFDQTHDVFYRPERPEFHKILVDAEDAARKTLAPQIEAKIRAGDLDQSDWVL